MRQSEPFDAPSRVLAGFEGVVVGTLHGTSHPGALYVDYAGNGHGPLPARTTVPLSTDQIAAALRGSQGVLLVFEGRDPALPIIIGLVQSSPASPFAELLSPSRQPPERALEARLDGERVVLNAEREIVLRCGAASITLRSDGKVLIRGAYVETHSRGVNCIKGGSVRIN